MTKKDGVWCVCVCDKVACERWCVCVCVKVACDKVVCERWCVTKWCVKDGV